MKEHTVYLAGGCYWGVQRYADNIRGVIRTDVGFANGFVEAPTYEQVKHTQTGHAETVRVVFDEDALSLKALLRLFFLIVDPTTQDQQGHDIGHQYRTGVYWCDPADEPVIRQVLAEQQEKYTAPVVTEALPLNCFYLAEEYHQKYLEKIPGGYCHVPFERIAWVGSVDPAEYDD